MDTSKTYIKMCKKAEDIQGVKWLTLRYSTGAYPWIDGDNFVLGSKVFMYDGCSHSEGFIEPEIYNRKCTWLPRQDQLQEMVDWHWYKLEFFKSGCQCDDPKHKHKELHLWVPNRLGHTGGVGYTADSLEQLWLAFVMKEKYNKVWDGGDWIKFT